MGAVNQYQLARDANFRYDGVIIRPEGYVNEYVVTANVAMTVTVPTGARIVTFSASADFYVNFSGAMAVIPATSITDGTAPLRNPTTRDISGIASFSLVSGSNANINIGFMS